ncbi:hypothetical protein AAH991_37180 [Microbispora sp. ZYX-F-249]|uniref:Ribbon-helix-helix protein, CopG family n=1 Tax=Microbispora maris TaxID=3144104 RepID=A0ABV0B353_9ACTN
MNKAEEVNASRKQDDEASGKSVSSRFVRLSINLGIEPMEILKTLAEKKGLSITDAVRRAIKIWQFVEDQVAQGNELQVVEKKSGDVHKVMLL